MSPPVLHLILAGSLAALIAAGVRMASTLAPSGLERIVASAALSAAAAVIEALGLGLVGLSGSSIALSTAAALTWLAARRWLPSPAVGMRGELARWWGRLTPSARAGIGAVAGFGLALGAIELRRPEPGFDGIAYHLPEVVGFIQSGHAGSVLDISHVLPVGSYPLTNEVLLAWLTGISHGFPALTLWSLASGILLIAAGWLGLRRMGVAVAIRVLALAALMLGPLLVLSLPQPGTDLPALSWLVCAGALCLSASERPALLGPGLVAFGLAIGTKSTTATMGVLAVGACLWTIRTRLAAVRTQLILGAGTAILVGGTWYIRNLIEHGSPLWPFYATPWGDPVPEQIRLVSHTLLERFKVTLIDHAGVYAAAVSGSVVLILGGVILAPLARRRSTVLAGAAVMLGAFAWANAPVTGLPDAPALVVGARSSIRYLLPVFAAGAVALALAGTEGPRAVRVFSVIALIGALAWELGTDLQHGFYLPFDSWLPAGAALGALGALIASVLSARAADGSARSGDGRRRLRARAAGLGAPAAIAAAALVLGAESSGFVARHAMVSTELDAPAAGFLARDRAYVTGSAPVAVAPFTLGLLAGDRLRHRVTLISERAPCAEVRARARRGLVVIEVIAPQPVAGRPGLNLAPNGTARECLARQATLFTDGIYRIYGPPQ